MSFTRWLQRHHLMRASRATRIAYAAAVLAAIMLTAPSVSNAHVNVYGGPIDTYTPSGGGWIQWGRVLVNDAGTAVESAAEASGSGAELGIRIVRWEN